MTDSCVLNIVRKYRNNRSRDSPFRGTLYKKIILKDFGELRPHFYTYNVSQKTGPFFIWYKWYKIEL